MAFYQFRKTQFIESDKKEVWDFISDPSNLQRITPPAMDFRVTSDQLPQQIYPGLMISYRVRPILRIRMTWVTEITQVKELNYFVDEQRHGPYKIWHHEHIIEEVKDGVIMKDIVSYMPPFGILGRIANALFIKKSLEKIFRHRTEAVDRIFNQHVQDRP